MKKPGQKREKQEKEHAEGKKPLLKKQKSRFPTWKRYALMPIAPLSACKSTAIGLQKHCYQWAIALQSEAKSYANGGRLHSFWKADAIIHINKDCRDTYK